MTLVSARTKFKVRRIFKNKIQSIPFKIQYWILTNIIQVDVIEEFAQDHELLHDYYLEPYD